VSKLSLGVEKEARRDYGPDVAVARLAQADRAIAEAITATDAVKLVATAKALEEWARAVHAGEEHERQAAIFVLRAKRNAGDRIAEAQRRGEVAGKGRPENVGGDDISAPAKLSDIGVTRDESSEWKKLASEWSDDALTAAAEEMARPSLAGIQSRSPGMFSSDSPEWYTPKHIVASVVKALGHIDLDPCADPGKGIPAERHFTVTDNGLDQPWRGRVYMNPPYGREIGAWVDKLAEEYEYGNVSEAIALVPARTDTSWWAHLPASMVCFVTGRLSFSDHENAAPFPSAVCYLGTRSQAFAETFIEHGLVYVRLETEAAA
jgi:phage N-6-adenine-methyltransferase